MTSTSILVHDGDRQVAGPLLRGHSWEASASELVGHRVWPRDLAGEVKEFDTAELPRVSLRSMVVGDLPVLGAWLAHPHLERWFAGDGEPTPERIRELYLPAIEGAEPTRLSVVECNGRSIGFCQDYVVRDHPDYAMLTPDPDAVGIDYAIGEPAFVGRGIGVRLLWALLHSVVARRPDATTVVAAPDHRNEASLRALEKVGFRRGVWFDQRQPDGSVTTMVGCTLDLPTVLG